MTALIRMRLAGFLASGRVIAPGIALLAVLGVLYGGGASSATSAYGYSATMLFPIMALSTKLLLDTEPDVQRRLARITVGAGREGTAGLLAAVLTGLAISAVAMLVPWAVGAIAPGQRLAGALLLGGTAHVLALAGAVALGALASRAVTGSIGKGAMVLAAGTVLYIVLGLKGSIAPWLVPPVLATARALSGDAFPSPAHMALLAVRAGAWSTVTLSAYAYLRRHRA